MSDPFPCMNIETVLYHGMRERDRMRNDQLEHQQNSEATKWFCIGGFALAIIGWVLSYLPAHAEDIPKFEQVDGPPCVPADVFAKTVLGEKYSEIPFVDLTTSSPSGQKVSGTLFANPQTGTWTLAIRPKSEIVCLFMSGDGMKPAKPFTFKKPGIPS